MITIKKVTSKKDLKAFITFPFSLYNDSKYWIPPIISQEIKTFDIKENPIFKDAEATLFLAYKNNKIVGRIAIIINWLEVKEQNIKKVRFGWFDFIDDLQVSKMLLDEVYNIGKQHNLEYTEGPVGFSNLDKVGVMTSGFNEVGNMVAWYNHEYYYKHYITHGFVTEKKYEENRFPFTNVKPELFFRLQEMIKKRYQLTALKFTKTEEVMPYADKMFDLFNETYNDLASFVKITEIQKDYFKKKFFSFINPEYIKFVVDKDDKLVAFAIVMPRFSEAIQDIKGRLFPFGFLKILKAKKHSKDVMFYLIGVHKDYQNKGVHAVIFNEYYNTFKDKGIKTCYRTAELSDNDAIRKIWKNMDPEIYVTRETLKKTL
jgi:GNAT superfamily N-acetyltransferase